MVDQQFKNAVWVIEGDINKFFDTVNHDILLQLLRKTISCDKTLALIKSALKAGYFLDKKCNSQHRQGLGTPQESIISPILANIYLHEFDLFMMELMDFYNKGKRRRQNPAYTMLLHSRLKALKMKDSDTSRKLRIELRNIPSGYIMDPNYVRIRYVRYADDFVISCISSKAIASEIKTKIADWLSQKLKLTLNLENTKVTHFSKRPIYFLGTEIINRASTLEKPVSNWKKGGKSIKKNKSFFFDVGRVTPRVSLHAPISKILKRLIERRYLKYNANGSMVLPTARKSLVNLDHADILMVYNSVTYGILNYFSFADNRSSLKSIVRLIQRSCALTLALKYKARTIAKIFKRFGRTLMCPTTKKIFNLPTTLKRIRLFRPDIQSSNLE